MLVQQKEDEKKAIEEANRPDGMQDIMQLPLPGQGAVGSNDADKIGLTKLGINPEKFNQPTGKSPPMPGINPEKYGIDPDRLARMGPVRQARKNPSKEKK